LPEIQQDLLLMFFGRAFGGQNGMLVALSLFKY
jgi:hypothetical protein